MDPEDKVACLVLGWLVSRVIAYTLFIGAFVVAFELLRGCS